MATYPGAVASFTTKNTNDTIQAAHINDLQSEITAIENALVNGGFTINGTLAVTGTLGVTGASTIGGLLTVNAAGIFTAATANDETIAIINTTSGANARANLVITAGTANTWIYTNSQGYGGTPSTTEFVASGAGGMSVKAIDAAGAIRFYTGGLNLRWTVDATGVYSSGTVSPGSNYMYLAQAQILIGNAGTGANSSIVFQNANGTVGSISTNGSATAYNTSSDQRLKADRGVAIDVTVLRETVVHDFDWIADGTPGRGVFAQEAIAVNPRAVTAEPWGVDYSKYVADLIVGWQQHEARLAALEDRP